MGVALALQTLDRALKEKAQEKKAPAERRIITYGPIIHNPQVLELYERLGVIRTEDLEAVRTGDVVIIRAHGVPRDDECRLRERGAVIRDATCPKVKRAQLAIAEVTAGGRTLLLFGEEDHPEVKGLVSYAGGLIHIFDSLDALRGLDLPRGAYALAAQTTQDQGEFSRICDWTRAQLGEAGETPVLRTICDATSKRQDEVLALAEQVEVMIVVGGKESGNTRRLAALAASCGVPTWHVESPDELPLAALRDKRTAGLTAGASTPKALIDQTEIRLERM
jgi:4-hydroxy-3-methylbut-2-enyl diphosphate reductase